MNTYVVSNIYSNLDKLKQIVRYIDEIENCKDSIIIFIGDYTGFGNSNEKTIIYLMELSKDRKNIKCLKGKHESMLYNQLKSYLHTIERQDIYYDKNFLYYNGGKGTFDSIINSENAEAPIKIEQWLKSLPDEIIVDANNLRYKVTYSKSDTNDIKNNDEIDYTIVADKPTNDCKVHKNANSKLININCGSEMINKQYNSNKGTIAVICLDDMTERYF